MAYRKLIALAMTMAVALVAPTAATATGPQAIVVAPTTATATGPQAIVVAPTTTTATGPQAIVAAPQPPLVAQPVIPQAPVTTSPAYALGIGDEVQVTLFGQPDMTVRTRVRDDGTIAYPLLGSIVVAGRRTSDVATTIASRLRAGGYYAKPVVGVDVTSYVSQSFTLFGNFATPGVYPLDRPTTVAMAVARGGGAKADAADYALLRRPGGGEVRIDLADTAAINTPLQAGDMLVVPDAPLVYVYGQVGSPGSYPVRTGMTLRQALVRAGGPTLAGNEKSVTLRRDGQVVKRVDLNEEARGDDVLFVNERFF